MMLPPRTPFLSPVLLLSVSADLIYFSRPYFWGIFVCIRYFILEEGDTNVLTVLIYFYHLIYVFIMGLLSFCWLLFSDSLIGLLKCKLVKTNHSFTEPKLTSSFCFSVRPTMQNRNILNLQRSNQILISEKMEPKRRLIKNKQNC